MTGICGELDFSASDMGLPVASNPGGKDKVTVKTRPGCDSFNCTSTPLALKTGFETRKELEPMY